MSSTSGLSISALTRSGGLPERTNGFANAHYASGWFRVASGKTVRMYRAGGTRLVLLPPKGDGAAVLSRNQGTGEIRG